MNAAHIKLFSHRVINVESLARAASITVEEKNAYPDYMLGLLTVLTMPDHYNR